MADFVSPNFDPPVALDHECFRLRPLRPEHNEADYDAWSSSIEHIHATPGFESRPWPHPMTLDDNRRDLEMHADDFRARRGFTYTVLAAQADRVIGCVYIYPSDRSGLDAEVRSWVRVSDKELDGVLHAAVVEWLDTAWPFQRVQYARRPR